MHFGTDILLIPKDSMVSYINTEYPKVTYINHTILKYSNVTSLRVNRKDPRHYVSLKMETLVPLGNNMTVSFSFYELLTNKYHNSYLEVHNGFCDLIEMDPLFGSQFKKNLLKLNRTCPLPPGEYKLTDMAIPFVPKNFPFQRGRIYGNFTFNSKGVTYSIAHGHIDMEIKQMHVH